jgi:hypothetical protein
MITNESPAAGGSASGASEIDLLTGDASDIALEAHENQLDFIAPSPDCAAIKAGYAANDCSIRELARRNGVSDTAVRKKAKLEGWKSSQESEAPPANPPPPPPQTSKQTEVDEGEDFEWTPENPDIIFPGVPAIAIYLNRWNHVVIRQEGGCRRCGDDDKFVFIDKQNLPALIHRLELLHRSDD